MPNRRLVRRIFGQRNAGADADLEDAPADALRRGDRRVASALEHRPEHDVVDRRPARIGLGHRLLVELDAPPLFSFLGTPLRLDKSDYCCAPYRGAGEGSEAAGSPARSAKGRRALALATLPTWPMNCRALVSQHARQREGATGRAGDVERAETGRRAGPHPARRPDARRSRRAGRSTGKAATGTPQASASSWTTPNVSVRLGNTNTSAAARWLASVRLSMRPRNFASGNRRRSSASCGPSPITTLDAGQVEGEKRLEVLLHRDASDRHEDRARQIELDRPLRTEQVGIDAARPHAEIAEAALLQHPSSATASPPW